MSTPENLLKTKNPAKEFWAGFLAGNQINLSVSINRLFVIKNQSFIALVFLY